MTHKNISIEIRELSNEGEVEIKIEDSGTGILNLDAAFTLGSKVAGQSPLNEHGFGMKHALASANPQNDSWSICTRTKEDIKNGYYKQIKAPYRFKDFIAEKVYSSWPGLINNSGTIIKFNVDRLMFKTIAKGIRGGVSQFRTIVDVLYEDLGFYYSSIIKAGTVQIILRAWESNGQQPIVNKPVGAVEPYWENFFSPNQDSEKISFSDDKSINPITVDYAFGRMKESPPREEFNNATTRKYYKKSMSSSGVEIRVNGRLIRYNLFKEIWNIEKHNSYNYLLITLNLKSTEREALPQTRTSKNGFREGDEILDNIYEWIRSHLKEPLKDVSLSDHETDLFQQLKRNMSTSLKNAGIPHTISTEMFVFQNTNDRKNLVRLDMYLFCQNTTTIYEGKKDSTSSKDVYQLRMYWDGMVYDGIKPDEGVLVAKEHPHTVAELIQIVNNMKDANGHKYNLILKTWSDLGIDF